MNDVTTSSATTRTEAVRQLMEQWQASPMAKTMGMKLLDLGDGTATLEAWPSAVFNNPQKRMHGGFAAALLDSGLGLAVQTRLGPGIGYGTIELKVNYTGKIDVDTGRLVITGQVVHAGRTLFTAEARITDAAGKVLAHGSGTFMVFPK